MALYWSAAGWIGTVLYLSSYGYLSVAPEPQRSTYYGCSLVAAALVAVSSVYFRTWQSVLINAFWCFVSYRALLGRNLALGRFRAAVVTGSLAAITAAAGGTWWLSSFDAAASVLAWGATVAFCAGYLLFAAQRIGRPAFLGYNLYAASALLPRLVFDANWPVVALETAWALISVAGLASRRWKPDPVEPEWALDQRRRRT